MRRAVPAIPLFGVFLLVSGGCPLNLPQNPNTTGQTVGDVTRARTLPPLPSALISVEVLNLTGTSARIDVRMELAGRLVRQTVRTISEDATPNRIGVDRADRVSFSATIFADGDISVPLDVRRINRDFADGDVVQFILRLPDFEDCNENEIDDATEADSDEDGVIDDCDGCPNDPLKTEPGMFGCGVVESDSDGDGIPDSEDGCPNDPAKSEPGACGCGVADTDMDEDGTPDCMDGCPEDTNKIAPGTCGCGTPDSDMDEDGTPDCNDGCPADFNKTTPGECGCGNADVDSDDDGTLDCFDDCPNDPLKTDPGACGCGIEDRDDNENGVIDCLEVDEPAVQILDREEDVRVGQSDTVTFRVAVNDVEATDRLIVRVERLNTKDDDSQTVFDGTQNPAERILTLPIEGLVPGSYRIIARVERDAELIAIDQSVGLILVNNAPFIAITNPIEDTLLPRGQTLNITFTAFDPDDDARIRILLDTDQKLDGIEPVLIADISEDDDTAHSFVFDPNALELPDGTYFIAAVIDDTFDDGFDYSARICVTSRLLGTVATNQLPAANRHMIRGTIPNLQFGFSVDMSRDADADGKADLLASDPRHIRIEDKDEFDLGAAHLFLTNSDHNHPGVFAADTSRTDNWFFGEFTLGRAGERVAMIDSVNGDSVVDFLIGEPLYSFATGDLMGRGYIADGAYSLGRKRIFLSREPFPRTAYYEGAIEETAGKDVAGLRDINGDGTPDFAVGGTQPGGIGKVTIIRGGTQPPSGALAARGYQISGERVDGRFGCEIESCADLDDDGYNEIVIGEPGPLTSGYEAPGCVYLVFGAAEIGDDDDDDDAAIPASLRVRKFVGEQSRDGFGFAIRCGDFDCDGKTDMIVGAPNAIGGTGRVYLIYDIGNEALPDVVMMSDLGGETLAGARIDGAAAGSWFGYALANLRDFDSDEKPDVVVGAPGTANARGSVWFIYGGTRPTGSLTATDDDCEFQAFEVFPSGGTLDADQRPADLPPGIQFGHSLSMGNARGNSRSDVAIGAPGYNNRGAVFVIDGALTNNSDDDDDDLK